MVPQQVNEGTATELSAFHSAFQDPKSLEIFMEKPDILDFKSQHPVTKNTLLNTLLRTDPLPEDLIRKVIEVDPQSVNYPDSKGMVPLLRAFGLNKGIGLLLEYVDLINPNVIDTAGNPLIG